MTRIALLALLCSTLPARAQRDAKVPDPDPEIERKSFIVADGFEVSLWAADPLLAKPIQMNWDAAGRLWVATSEAYPQIKPGAKQNDKVLILEDTKNAGKADKVTVFADGLLIPTGVEPGDGGAYVADSTDLLFLKCTDGTGKANVRRVLLSGFGTEDTHHIIHTFRWGPDGCLYFNQSVYIHSHIETPYGVRRLGAGGIWQYRPETQRLEVHARGWWNSWGHHWDRFGQEFVTDGAGTEGINHLVVGASYTPPAPGAPARVLQGLNPGTPKYCGLEILSGRHIPEDWRGSLITNDFRGHRVCRYVVQPDGSGYAARELKELIKSNHPAFRPIDVKMGPDGAIYIADWYNPIIQHGEVDFRDPRRDVTHGRIWRATAKGRPLVDKPKLVGATTEALLEALKAPEDWTRHHARRVLKERGKEVLPALAKWTANRLRELPGEPERLEALWTYQSLDELEPNLLASLLAADDYRIRAAAVRVAAEWHEKLPDPLHFLAPRVADDHPQVRLEAVRALARIPNVRAAELALTVLDRPVDRWIDYALWLTLRELEPQWMPALQQGRFDYGGKTDRLLFALQAVGSKSALPTLVSLVKAGKVPEQGEEAVLTMIAGLGGPTELALVFDRATKEGTPARLRTALLTALEHAARQRGQAPAGDLKPVGFFLNAEDDAVRSAAARLCGLWKQEWVRQRLVDLARAPETSTGLRRATLEGIASLGGRASRDGLDDIARDAKALPAARHAALIVLVGVNLDAAASRAADVLSLAPDGAGAAEVFDAFLHLKNGPVALANGLSGRKLSSDVAKIGVRAVRASVRDAPELIDALTKAGNLTAGVRKLTPDEMKQMIADVAKLGDPARGEAVFRRKDQLCLKCHAIAGAGGQVGPDLSSVGASAQVDYLIESLLEPNKVVKEGYHSIRVDMKDGRLFTGIKVRQTDTELILRTAEDKEIALVRKNIDETKPGPSLMPDGLTDPLTRGELVDLVRFLSELGKVGPYSISKARLVRRWRALTPTAAVKDLLCRDGLAASTSDDPALTWEPAYTTVAGALPVNELGRIEFRKPSGQEAVPVAVVRCQLDVSTGGPVRLKLNSTKGLNLWLDRTPVAAQELLTLDLRAGLHTLTFVLDLTDRRDRLACELDDAPGSPARARVVGGK
jgi:putative heme-binding domain-containing protein